MNSLQYLGRAPTDDDSTVRLHTVTLSFRSFSYVILLIEQQFSVDAQVKVEEIFLQKNLLKRPELAYSLKTRNRTKCLISETTRLSE